MSLFHYVLIISFFEICILDLEWWLASREVVETELEEEPHSAGMERNRTTRIRSDRRQHEDYSDDDDDDLF